MTSIPIPFTLNLTFGQVLVEYQLNVDHMWAIT